MIESIKDIVAREAQAILNIPIGDEYEKAVNLIVHHVHELKGKLITSGMGKAGQISVPQVLRPYSSIPVRLSTVIWAFCRKTTCSFWYPTPARQERFSNSWS